jgi:hypothetical protein
MKNMYLKTWNWEEQNNNELGSIKEVEEIYGGNHTTYVSNYSTIGGTFLW